jgi:hypothetical protein
LVGQQGNLVVADDGMKPMKYAPCRPVIDIKTWMMMSEEAQIKQ